MLSHILTAGMSQCHYVIKYVMSRREWKPLGVISKATTPTQWRAGMVVLPKSTGVVRICVDLRPLNDKSGIRADSSKTSAILQMEPLNHVSELRRFLGITNQLGMFSPCLAEISQPLRETC